MNAPQYVLVKVQLMIRLQTRISYYHTLVICTWLCHVACIQKALGQERERTSHFTIWTTWVILSHVCFKTAWICLACLSIPRLSWVRSMERWLAILQASSAIFCHSVTCLGTDRCCWAALSKKLVDKREEGLLTSQFEQFGWFSDMFASRLPEYTLLAWIYLICRDQGQWKGDWQCYKPLLPQCHMSRDKPMLLG